jgi:hypothetical protein
MPALFIASATPLVLVLANRRKSLFIAVEGSQQLPPSLEEHGLSGGDIDRLARLWVAGSARLTLARVE